MAIRPRDIVMSPSYDWSSNDICLINDNGDRIYTQARFCNYYEEPIMVGVDRIYIKDDGSVVIGTRTIPTHIVDKIIQRRNEVWDGIPF